MSQYPDGIYGEAQPHPTPAEGTPIATPETDSQVMPGAAEHGRGSEVVYADTARSLETRLITTQSRLEEAEVRIKQLEGLLGAVRFQRDSADAANAELRAHLARHQTSGGSKP